MTELNIQNVKPLRHFTKHLFLISKVYAEREKAREDIYSHLQKMRSSIIRMSLTYTDVDRLKQKIGNFVNWERKYSKFFKPDDPEKQELKGRILSLENELSKEREEKFRIMSEHEERIKELTESLEGVKHKLRHLMLEKARRHHRLKILEEKISQKVDTEGYYSH